MWWAAEASINCTQRRPLVKWIEVKAAAWEEGGGVKTTEKNVLAAMVTVLTFTQIILKFTRVHVKKKYGFTYVFKGKPKHSKLTNEAKIYYVCKATIKHNVCVLSQFSQCLTYVG